MTTAAVSFGPTTASPILCRLEHVKGIRRCTRARERDGDRNLAAGDLVRLVGGFDCVQAKERESAGAERAVVMHWSSMSLSICCDLDQATGSGR
jgi:hypothetical protein